MGLLKKILKRGAGSEPQSTHFHDSESLPEPSSRNAPRRELIHRVVVETVRQHGVPSDWIDCVVLSVVDAKGLTGMHVHLVVRQGHDSLLPYVPAFQGSFMTAITRYEPRVADWLLSVCWQFDGMGSASGAPMPDPRVWSTVATQSTARTEESEMEQDLKALFAIRDAALRDAAPPVDFQPTQPGR